MERCPPMSPVSASMPSVSMPSISMRSDPMRADLMLADPFINKLRMMCLKDPIVQGLYDNRLSWADIPSDDEPLELDDWESYHKVHEYAKTSYQRTYSARYEPPRNTMKKQKYTVKRVPYLTLKQNRFGSLHYDSPVSVSPAEPRIIPEPVDTPILPEPVDNPVEEVQLEEVQLEEVPLEVVPLEEVPLEEVQPQEKIPTQKITIKKMTYEEKKRKEKEKQLAKKLKKAPVFVPHKKRFSFCQLFTNIILFISVVISLIIAGVLMFM